MHTSQQITLLWMSVDFFQKLIIASFFLSVSPSTHTPFLFRIPDWYKVDPSRKQKSVKQGLICYNFLFACWVDVCITNRKRHQTAKADFIFSLQSQPNFSSLILSFSLQLGHVAVPLTAKRKRKSFAIVVHLTFMTQSPHFSHVHIYILTHIYSKDTAASSK